MPKVEDIKGQWLMLWSCIMLGEQLNLGKQYKYNK